MGASERLRPILMTACAMTVGMVPMALALERGSQMQAPLGRAVIGGLVMSTFATLLVVPSIFALVIGKKVARSPSIYPDDPESAHYDPNVYAGEEHADPHHSHGDGGQPLSSRRPGVGFHTRGAPECHPLTRRTLMRRELGKVARAAARMHRPLTWRSPMRRDLWPMVPYRSAYRCWLLFGLLSALAMPGCSHKGEVELHERHEAPDRPGDQPDGPEHRPGRRAAQLHRELRAHVDLSQADRLHPEVDRGHRRQGEEGRCARHPLRARADRGG